MTLGELKTTDWYNTRPEIIKEAIELRSPFKQYEFVGTNVKCYIVSYDELTSNKIEDVTVTVQKTGVKKSPDGSATLVGLHTNKIFDVKLEDLIEWQD